METICKNKFQKPPGRTEAWTRSGMQLIAPPFEAIYSLGTTSQVTYPIRQCSLRFPERHSYFVFPPWEDERKLTSAACQKSRRLQIRINYQPCYFLLLYRREMYRQERLLFIGLFDKHWKENEKLQQCSSSLHENFSQNCMPLHFVI